MVDHEAVVAGVDADRRVETGQLEVGEAERLGMVLQLAVVVGHAHRADVVALDEEHLDDRAAMVVEPSRAGDHVHAVGHLGDACRQRTLRAGDLHAAQPAGADVGESVEMTQRRDVDAVLPRDVEDRLPGAAGDVDTVDAERVDGHQTAANFDIVQTPAGQVRSSMWARYSSRKNRSVLNTGFEALCPRPHRLVSVTISARLSQSSQVVAVRFAVADPFEQGVELHRADPARDALAARLVAAEAHEVLGDVDHARGVVHDDHAARAHDRADLGERLVIDGHVEVIRRDAPARWATGLHRLERATVDDATADVEHDLAERDAQRHLDEPGVDDPAGEGEHLGSRARRSPDARVPGTAVADDRGDVGERLDVVDERRPLPQTGHAG